MRGKHSSSRASGRPEGITPAHAGKTELRRPRDFDGRDHPRACGENALFALRRYPALGSPPRMRGKLEGVEVVEAVVGITPAHAGKTRHPCGRPERPRDHPRACGGKLARDKAARIMPGITPAHAGKTRTMPLLVRKAGDHPRACGENASRSDSVSVL